MNHEIENVIDSRLQRIANVLLLNASFIDNLGLLNGKMGIAIFFYHYARYTGNEIYERYAGELIDEIYEEINIGTPVEFASGLTGVGWGIEYLVKNGFVEADTDEALGEIDNAIFRATMEAPLSIKDQNQLFGFGFFYLTRLKGKENDDNNLETLKKKQLSIYMMDECERLLTNETMFGVPVPKFTLYQLNSLAWFIWHTRKLGLFPAKSDKLIQQLAVYLEAKMTCTPDSIDLTIFRCLTDELKKLIPDTGLCVRYDKLAQKISNHFGLSHENEEQLIYEYIKSGWCPIIFGLTCSTYNGLAEKALSIVENDVNWNQRLDKLNKDNMRLDGGMAGLGMALLNDVMKRKEEMKVINETKPLTV